MLYFYQHLPQYINPIAFTIGSFSVRWYALSYLVSFLAAYLVLIWRIKKGEWPEGISNLEFRISNKNAASQIPNESPTSHRLASIRRSGRTIVFASRDGQTTNHELRTTVFDFLLVAFFSSLIGGRLGYVLFYDLPYFISHPLSIISPYDYSSRQFVGIYGMSYHGALIGVLLGSYIFLHLKKINFWRWADFVSPAAALGYFFGRIGNFLNGELYGRITISPPGMYFASDPSRLRYPSQLLEAFLEGLVLFVILWKTRKIKSPSGTLFSIYLVGYGFFRILAEFFREPDPQIGFILNYFTLGQLLSLIMVIGGIIILVSRRQKI